MKQFLPSLPLLPYIKRFVLIETEHGMHNTILPDTSIVIGFRLKGHVHYTENGVDNTVPLAVITGIRRSARIMHYSTCAATLLVIFNETGAAAFFRQPLHELSDLSLSLDDLMHDQKISDAEEQLAEAANDTERIRIIEQFLLKELKRPETDVLIARSIQQIHAAHGIIRIKDMLRDWHISRDPFEKRFRRITGTSPKQFAGIVRLRHLIDHYSHAGSLTEAAYEAGYFDQSHFIKDFRSFTGQTPQAFFKSPSYW